VSEILRYQAETNLFGFSLLWIDISMPGKQKPVLKLVDRRHVVPEKGVYIYRLGDMAGISYLDPAYTPWTLQLGETDNLGMLFKCAPWVIYKRGDISDWATFNEIFGMPFRKATYTRGDTKAKEELEEAMQMQASQSWVVHPEGTNITTEASGSSSSSSKDSFKEFAEFANSEMSKAILGNTMTTDAEGGNYKGEVHEESQADVFAADEISAMELLNGQFYQLLQMHGYNPNGGRFEFVYDDTLELDKEVTVVKEITAMVDVDQDYVRERFGVPAPKPGTIPANRVNAIQMPTVGDVKQSLAERVGSFFA
jgi:phage gp29-like protein